MELRKYQFQLTRPRGARLFKHFIRNLHKVFQLTRPRGARRTDRSRDKCNKNISTHTPAWGATLCIDDLCARYQKISTHTPAWGATISNRTIGVFYIISTHTPAWGATLAEAQIAFDNAISTHTPAWGATRVPYDIDPKTYSDFNSHARVGRDAQACP